MGSLARAAPSSGSETLDVGGWQVVVTGGHAVLPEGMTHLPDEAFQHRASLVSVACPSSLVSIGGPRRAASLDGDALREVARLVDVALAHVCDVVGHQLQRRDAEERHQEVGGGGDAHHVLALRVELVVVLLGDGDDGAAPRAHLFGDREPITMSINDAVTAPPPPCALASSMFETSLR